MVTAQVFGTDKTLDGERQIIIWRTFIVRVQNSFQTRITILEKKSSKHSAMSWTQRRKKKYLGFCQQDFVENEKTRWSDGEISFPFVT